MKIFVDSSFFFAFIIQDDAFHQTAIELMEGFEQQKDITLVTSNYILDESYTLVRVKRNLEKALLLRRAITKTLEIEVVRVTAEDESAAWDWFEKPWSRLSFTDCVSFAVMKRLGLTDVATFDDHFTRAGFTILKP